MKPFLEPIERLVLIRDGIYAMDDACNKRARLIMALDRGSTITHAARSEKCSPRYVKYYLSRYLEHRTPAALRSWGDPARTYYDSFQQSSWARHLVILGGAQPAERGGVLPLSDEERRELEYQSHAASDPEVRYRAAIRFAIDRGANLCAIARAAARHRNTIRDVRDTAITGISLRQRKKQMRKRNAEC
jgi:hypothetical protein